MKNRFVYALLIIVFCLNACSIESSGIKYSLVLEQPNNEAVEIGILPADNDSSFQLNKTVEGIDIEIKTRKVGAYVTFKATAKSPSGTKLCYLSLKANYVKDKPWNYNGEVFRSEIFRQSPHDVNAWITDSLAKQAIPMVALQNNNGFTVIVSNSPVYCNNYSTQQFDLIKKEITLSSGDNGQTPGMKPETAKMMDYNAEKGQKFTNGTVTPYYHSITANHPHVFEGIFIHSKAADLNKLRKDVVLGISTVYSGGKYTDYMGALAFTVPYMNLRVNESKKSTYWVVPAVEYSNIQYCRDAFWISTMLPDSMSAQCLKNELDSVNHYAEYPLYIPIWAWRTKAKGGDVDLVKVQKYIDVIEKHVRDGCYYSFDKNDGRHDFQYWNDMIAFDTTDVISYNQGLLAVALNAAEKLGLKNQTTAKLAASKYKALYNAKLGFLPVSRMKDSILSPDVLVGDLLSQLYFGTSLLGNEIVTNHTKSIISKSKTPYGYKITSNAQGKYLQRDAFDDGNYVSQVNRDKLPEGKYQHGGSWTLYDMLFLMDAYLYHIPGIEREIVWRAGLDFKLGATSYEYINTVTGEPWKPNMGWNSAIYAIWTEITKNKPEGAQLLESIDNTVK